MANSNKLNSPAELWLVTKEQACSPLGTPVLHLLIETSDFKSSDIGVSATTSCSVAKPSPKKKVRSQLIQKPKNLQVVKQKKQLKFFIR